MTMKPISAQTIRIPSELHDKLRHEALVERRTINQQIQVILEKHYKRKKPNAPA